MKINTLPFHSESARSPCRFRPSPQHQSTRDTGGPLRA